jgi:RimJ/RimL family protein N-acetyltransferase
VLPEAPVLTGRRAVLEPLAERHADDLARAADADRASYAWTSVPQGAAAMRAYVRELVAAPDTLPFAQMVDGRACGVTRFLAFRSRPGSDLPYAVEVGGTWLAASAQGTGVNREAKLLLMTHAFEVWGVGRVDFKTDARNERSRAALASIGATFEGVLRCWQPSHAAGEQGLLRDSAMFSVVAAQWLGVKEHLARRRGAVT